MVGHAKALNTGLHSLLGNHTCVPIQRKPSDAMSTSGGVGGGNREEPPYLILRVRFQSPIAARRPSGANCQLIKPNSPPPTNSTRNRLSPKATA